MTPGLQLHAAFTVLGTFEVVTDWLNQLDPADSLSKEQLLAQVLRGLEANLTPAPTSFGQTRALSSHFLFIFCETKKKTEQDQNFPYDLLMFIKYEQAYILNKCKTPIFLSTVQQLS